MQINLKMNIKKQATGNFALILPVTYYSRFYEKNNKLNQFQITDIIFSSCFANLFVPSLKNRRSKINLFLYVTFYIVSLFFVLFGRIRRENRCLKHY